MSAATLPKLGYSYADAAKMLGISERTLWKLRDEGRIKSYRVDKRVLFTESALRDFISANET